MTSASETKKGAKPLLTGVKASLLIGCLAQIGMWLILAVVALLLNLLRVRPIGVVLLLMPGSYVASLVYKPRTMEDPIGLLLWFVFNALVYAWVWYAGVRVWQWWHRRSHKD